MKRTMWAPMLVVGLGVGVGILAAAVGPTWLLIVALLVIVAGGALFYLNLQKT
ncbi:MAG: hypothetical protein M3N68_04805 [Actinomycetota bacterium]|nr:hypothetical protein [Actinomycetota bacterium]